MLQVNQLIGFGAGGGGSIQFVGGNTASKAGATSGNSTIALNSGLTGGISSAVSDGDLVIAAFSTGDVAERSLSITDGSTGYTLIGSELYSNDIIDTNLRVAYKFVSGDVSTTFGPTGATTAAGAMAVYCFRGVSQSTPLDVSVTTATGADSANANPPSITPVTAGAFIVAVGGCGIETASAFTSPDLQGFLTVAQSDSDSTAIGIGHKDDWTSGAFDPGAWTNAASNGAASWAAITIALRPA
jgi:hypothetical protein